MIMRANLRTSILAAVALAVLAGGCARTMHRRPSYGAANHAFFDRQAAATAGGAAHGLDPEEAALIHQRYRESMGGRAATTGKDEARSQVLILREDGHAGVRKE
jgi:hypothetical protein